LVLAVSCDEDPHREREALTAFTSRRLDGIIVMPAIGDHLHLRAEHEAGTPIVTIDRRPGFPGVDTVVVDNTTGARRGVEHLLAHGHTRIAFLGDRVGMPTANQRYAGYRAALAAADVGMVTSVIARNVTGITRAIDVASQLLAAPEPPTALFTAQNLITIGAIHTLRACGLQDEIALVGFDDFLLADLIEPPVTVVAQDPAEIGACAARRLFARIDGDDSPPHRDVVRTRLIPRGSGEIPAPGRPLTRR
jgi:LacI family transcriptional regulator